MDLARVLFFNLPDVTEFQAAWQFGHIFDHKAGFQMPIVIDGNPNRLGIAYRHCNILFFRSDRGTCGRRHEKCRLILCAELSEVEETIREKNKRQSGNCFISMQK